MKIGDDDVNNYDDKLQIMMIMKMMIIDNGSASDDAGDDV